MSENHKVISIPEEFHCFSTGQPFEHCIECEKYLLDEETDYFIEKAVKNYNGYSATDVIFEYAICAQCAEQVRKEISKESMAKIETFFTEHVDIASRMELINENPDKPEKWIRHCMVSNQPIETMEEYQIFAHCKGKTLNLVLMPYMISGKTLEQIQHLLSPQTRNELNDFMERNLGPSPELAEVLPGRRVVLI